jgi:hypothetical protein
LRRPKTLREHLDGLRANTWQQVHREIQVEEIIAPEYQLPKLEPGIDDLTDKELMDLFVKLTRWSDYLQMQFAAEEVTERYTEEEVRRLEGLYMTAHKPDKVSEAVTWVRVQMEDDPEIQRARDALRVIYARRKLKQMLFEAAERDAAVVSRELTRRTDTKAPGYRRADRGAP